MSIILKALKKAESASDKQGTPNIRASVVRTRSTWPTVVVAVCTVALGFFFALYVLRDTIPKPAISLPAQVTTAPSAGPAITGVIGAATINTDAVAHIRAGRHLEAENLLRNAIKQHPNDPYLRNHMGLALKKQGKLTEAAIEYEKAIELKPDYFIAMNNLAVTLEASGKKERARELYEKAIEGNPAISGAHLNYALLLEDKGDIDRAESQYHTFLTLSKDENLRGLVRRRILALR